MISLLWNRCYFCLFPSSRENATCKRGIDDVSNGDKITDSPSLITRAEILSKPGALFDGNNAMICSTCLQLTEWKENCSDNG